MLGGRSQGGTACKRRMFGRAGIWVWTWGLLLLLLGFSEVLSVYSSPSLEMMCRVFLYIHTRVHTCAQPFLGTSGGLLPAATCALDRGRGLESRLRSRAWTVLHVGAKEGQEGGPIRTAKVYSSTLLQVCGFYRYHLSVLPCPFIHPFLKSLEGGTTTHAPVQRTMRCRDIQRSWTLIEQNTRRTASLAPCPSHRRSYQVQPNLAPTRWSYALITPELPARLRPTNERHHSPSSPRQRRG